MLLELLRRVVPFRAARLAGEHGHGAFLGPSPGPDTGHLRVTVLGCADHPHTTRSRS